MIDPQWSILEDGLGYPVLCLGGLPGIDEKGREIITFTIKPNELMRKRYNLRFEKELDYNGNLKFKVLKLDLIPLNMYDDANKKWLYEKTFTHEPTELSKRFENLKTEIQRLQKRILLLEADNIRLNEQLDMARTNPLKFAKQGTELLEAMGKVISDITAKGKGEQ